MKRNTPKPLLTASLVALLPAAASAATNLVTNGDFETGDFTGWTEVGAPAINSTTPIAGSNSAELSGGGDAIEWDLTIPTFTTGASLEWTFDFNTTADPGTGGSDRFRLMSSAGAMITLRLTTSGVEAFDSGSAWYSTNTVGISTDTNYSVRVTVAELDATAGTDFRVDVSTDGGANYTLGSINPGTGAFQGGRDWDDTLAPDGVRYEDPASGALTVDNVTVTVVPEPRAALLGAIGLIGLLRRRR